MRITATVDRLDEGNGLVVIVDYKSGRPIPKAQVKDGRRVQLQLYGHLARAEAVSGEGRGPLCVVEPQHKRVGLGLLQARRPSRLGGCGQGRRGSTFPRGVGGLQGQPTGAALSLLLLIQAHLPRKRVQPMETLGLTGQQAEIISKRGRDILVTAGAGSGKTRVLVERYISLLGECSIPQIAAVTFTDAAASEMRERVRREVLTRPELRDHRPQVDEAVIGTIHSLCSRILREHPVEAAIDPAARVLSEDEAEFEIISACADSLEEAAAADGRRALALREIGAYSLTNHLPRMVARRNEVEAAYGALEGPPQAWADEIKEGLDASVASAVEQLRPWLIKSAAWLREAHERWGRGCPVPQDEGLPGDPGESGRRGLA